MRNVLFLLLAIQGIAFSDFTQDTLVSWMKNGAPFDFLLIDLREPVSDNITKVIGNDKCRPYNLVWQNEFTQNITKIAKDKHIVVYCKSGSRASAAASYLLSQEYLHVYNAGGFSTWTGPFLTFTASVCLPQSQLPAPSMVANTSKVVAVSPKNINPVNAPNVFVNLTNNNYRSFERAFTISGQSLFTVSKAGKGIYLSIR